ncbi:MAG: ABC-F family ATP-binding cassette domain-containing protein [Myxococcota bacterium]
MAVLLAEDVHKTWGDRRVLRGATLSVDAGEHVGLVGANGSGKSTLLGILSGTVEADRGRIVRTGRIARLGQDPTLAGITVDDVVRDALSWHGALVAAYERATHAGDLEAAQIAQAGLDTHGWTQDHKIDGVLDRLRAPPRDARLERLSGGERRRVALAATLLQSPDVLLLDEPTNHLDADATEWLEKWLAGFRGAVLLVTHDRYLLEATADRIVEVDRGETVSYAGSYGDYLVARAERQARLEQSRERLLAAITREAAWAARSPSARTTKQKARLNRLDVLRSEVPEIDDPSCSFSFKTGVPSGITLAEWHGVKKAYGGRVLFDGVDDVIRPGDRLGILGANGCGKSTLLRTLTGEVVPDAGQVLKGPRAKIGVLDQDRRGLDPDDTLFDAAGGGNDQVVVGGEPIHVATFLGRFGFTREAFGQHVGGLSGGERARLLLAKLMLAGATLLILDEPTNDLDLGTLRTLEEALLGFDGGLVVVSHDRAFVDRVCTRVLVFEPGPGSVSSVVPYASRSQWLSSRAAAAAAAAKAPVKPSTDRAVTGTAGTAKAPSARLSFREKQELDALPERIEALEVELAALESTLADPATYRERKAEVPGLSARLEALPGEIHGLYERWDALGKRA